MATTSSYNKKSSAVKRILSEARELSQDTSTEYKAAPLEDNIFEWHFTFRGPTDTSFSNGKYHGKIILPSEFPMRPPSVLILTPNGRWELNKKICLTFTGYHEEQWLPAWGIRTAVLGVQQFMSAKERAAVGIGSLETEEGERVRLAESSRSWSCPICQKTNDEILPDPDPSVGATRIVEALPEGLSVDSNPKSKQTKEATASTSNLTPENGSIHTDAGYVGDSSPGVEETAKEAGVVQAVEGLDSTRSTSLEAGGIGTTSVASSVLAAGVPDVVLTEADAGSRDKESKSEETSTNLNTSLPSPSLTNSTSPSTSASTSASNLTSSRSNLNSTASSSSSSLRQRSVPSSSTSNVTTTNPRSTTTFVPANQAPAPIRNGTGAGTGGVAAGAGAGGLTGIHLEIHEGEEKIATYDRAILSVCLCLVVLFVRVLFA